MKEANQVIVKTEKTLGELANLSFLESIPKEAGLFADFILFGDQINVLKTVQRSYFELSYFDNILKDLLAGKQTNFDKDKFEYYDPNSITTMACFKIRRTK